MRILLVALFLSASIHGMSQPNLDSLWGVWNNEEMPGPKRCEAMQYLVWQGYLFSNPDSAKILIKMQIEFGFDKDLLLCASEGYNSMGAHYASSGDYNEAIKWFKKGLVINDSLNNKKAMTKSWNNLGMVYKRMGLYPEAIDNLMKGLEVSETENHAEGLSNFLSNLAKVYQEQGEHEKAIEYYRRSRVLNEEFNDDIGLSNTLMGLGVAFSSLNKEDSADHYLLLAFSIKEQVNDRRGMSGLLDRIGDQRKASNNFSQAMERYAKALDIRKDIGDKAGIANSYVSIANLHFEMQEFGNSLEYGHKALELAQELGEIQVQKQAAKILYKGYEQAGKSDESLENYVLFIELRDSILSETNQRSLLRHEYKYEFEKEALTDSLQFAKKEAVLQERTEKQRIGLFAAGGGLLLVLALAFAIYSGKKKSDELLLNILPAETAKELKEKGHADAKLIEDVTVLFTDFKGFTAMAEQLSAKELVEDLNICFSEFDRIMEKYGIEKIKTIGDAYMAASGLPTANVDHAHNVINAAFEMRDFVEAGKQRKIEAGLPYFEIRIGVHTGPVVAGIVGIKKFQYDIWGDTVNTASRMESSGEAGKVNVSESTYKLVKDDFLTMPRGEIEAKGKGKIKMFFVDRV